MRLVHTSDWHLGRTFHQVGLLAAQAQFVDWLVQLVRSERLDAVLISGDVYDRALPSPDTVALLDDALTRLVDAGAQVVAASGNHDSAVRLGFASQLLQRAGVHIRASLDSIGTPVLLGDGELAVYPIPYLEPSVAATELGAPATHAGVLGAAMDRVRADAADRGSAVVLAHCFAAGGVAGESERDISVGGISVVPLSVFDGVSYAALGHLHAAQALGERAAYSGGPVAMSFGETGQVKAVDLLTIESGEVRRQSVPTPVSRPLAVLRGELDELLRSPEHAWAESAWCKVVLTDPQRPLGALESLRRRFPQVLAIDFDPQGAATPVRRYAGRAAASRPALEVCCDFLGHVRGGAAPTDLERAVLAEAIEASRTDRAHGEQEGLVRADRAGVA